MQPKQQATYLAMISIGNYDVYRSTMTTTKAASCRSGASSSQVRDAGAERGLHSEDHPLQEKKFGPYPFNSAGSWSRTPGSATPSRRRTGLSSTEDSGRSDQRPRMGSPVVWQLSHAERLGRHLAERRLRNVREVALGRSHGGPSTAEQFQKAYDDPDDRLVASPACLTDPADLFGQQGYLRGAMTWRPSGRRSDRTTSSSSCASGHSRTHTAMSRRLSSSRSPSACRGRTSMPSSRPGSIWRRSPRSTDPHEQSVRKLLGDDLRRRAQGSERADRAVAGR